MKRFFEKILLLLPFGFFAFFLIRLVSDYFAGKEIFDNFFFLAFFTILFLEKKAFESLTRTCNSQRDLIDQLIKVRFILNASYNKAIKLAANSDPKLALTIEEQLNEELGEIYSHERKANST